MTFLDDIQTVQSYKLTENGALALNTTKSALLDLFATSGALRSRSKQTIKDKFLNAMAEDKTLATKLAFYTRDIRGGLGERRTGRIMFNTLGKYYPDIMDKNVKLLAEYGRYDDLFSLFDTKSEQAAINVIADQLKKDITDMFKGKQISLLAKWLPSVNTSSYKTCNQAKKLCTALNMSQKEYRKTLSSLRAYLNVTEVRLSSKTYDLIKYDEVPSYAMHNYSRAFRRHDNKRFNDYMDLVKNNESKINASVLYPYDIVYKYLYTTNSFNYDNACFALIDDDEEEDLTFDIEDDFVKQNPMDYDVLEQQWRALPNYVTGNNKFLIMADVSGSMAGRPIATSIGLAMYFAERNKGEFANKFMTFSTSPRLVDIKGDTLFDKINYISSADWDMSTNLKAAFDLVLNTAIIKHSPVSDLPDSIVVITDMEFDCCTSKNDTTFYDAMAKRFADAGYKIPKVVFWNVNARMDTFHTDMHEQGVQFISGSSPSAFKALVDGKDFGPIELMLSVLNSPRYEQISVQA